MSNWFYEQWSKIVLWKPEEAAMLSLYVDPDNTSEMMSDHGEDIIVKLDLLLRRVERAVEAEILPAHKSGKVKPIDYVLWAEKENIELPEEMIAAVKSLPSPKLDAADDSKPLITKEKESLYKIIRGLIAVKYSYQPLSPGASKAMAHIVRDIQINEKIHGETIDAWINKAFKIPK